jgi:hypothetical protein
MNRKQIVGLEQRRTLRLPRWLLSYGPATIVAVAFVLLATRLFRLISQYAVNVFFSDQWDFNDATLFQKHSIWQIFTWQHGPHRQGLGGLFAKLVEPQFGWNSRIESFVVGGVIVAAALCALYLKKRLYGHLSFWDVLIPALIFIPAQYETLFVTANFAHGPFPLLLILLYCLAWTSRRSLVRYPLVLIINFLTIYTGFGLLLGVLTPVLLILDYRACIPEERLPMAYLVGAILVSLLSLGSFSVGYTFNADLACFSSQPLSPRYYLAYMALMFANFFAVKGVGTVQVMVGGAALIALLASLANAFRQLLRGQNVDLPDAHRERSLIITTLIAYSLLFCMSTAYGRLCGGLWTARASRYVIYLEHGVLGVYFNLLNIRLASLRRLLLAGLLLAVVAASSYVNQADMAYFSNIKLQWKRCYFMNEDANLCNQMVGFPIYTHDPEGVHLQEKLEYLRVTRQNLYTDAK